MLTEKLFAREETLPSWFMNAVGHFLSEHAAGFVISLASPTTIEVVAGADEAAAIIAVDGSWRWNEATVTRAHPGGGAGTYDIYVTAKATDIANVPVPFTDDTDYSWALAIVAHGATPPIVAGVVDIFRKVGEVQWDGAAITRIDQFVPATARHAHTHAAGQPDAIAPADIGALAVGGNETLASLHLTGAGAALAVDNNATIGGTLAVTGASTLSGLATAKAGLTLDAGAGTVGQTLTLTGRTGGAAVSSTLAVSAAGALTLTSGTGSLVGAVNGGTAFTAQAASFSIPGGSQYQVGGTQIALSNLSNATTGTGTTVVLSASPALSGAPTAPTAAGGTNTTQVATTAFVQAAVTGLATLASPTFTGVPAAPTAAVDTNTTQLATTAFVLAQASAAGDGTPAMDGAAARGVSTHYARADHVHPTDTSRAPLASPGLTGVPTAATAAVDTNTTQLATTAFVLAQASAAGDGTPAMNGAAARGVSTHYARADHVHPTDTSLAPLASPALTGIPTAPTAAGATNTTQLATTAFVQTAVSGLAALASPAFTGVPTVPTAAVGTSTTQAASTAFVIANTGGLHGEMTADVVGTGSMTNLTGLSFAIGAGETWVFDAFIYVTGSASSSLALQATGPASPTGVALFSIATAGGGGTSTNAAATAFSSSLTVATPSGSVWPVAVRLTGRIVNGANAGTVQVQFNTSNTQTAKLGSWLRAWRTA